MSSPYNLPGMGVDTVSSPGDSTVPDIDDSMASFQPSTIECPHTHRDIINDDPISSPNTERHDCARCRHEPQQTALCYRDDLENWPYSWAIEISSARWIPTGAPDYDLSATTIALETRFNSIDIIHQTITKKRRLLAILERERKNCAE
jgi:hypothetical protein